MLNHIGNSELQSRIKSRCRSSFDPNKEILKAILKNSFERKNHQINFHSSRLQLKYCCMIFFVANANMGDFTK